MYFKLMRQMQKSWKIDQEKWRKENEWLNLIMDMDFAEAMEEIDREFPGLKALDNQ